MTDENETPGMDVRFGGRTIVVTFVFRPSAGHDAAAFAAVAQEAPGPKRRMTSVLRQLVDPEAAAGVPCFHAVPHPVVGGLVIVNTDEPELDVAQRIRRTLRAHSCTARIEVSTVSDPRIWDEVLAIAAKVASKGMPS